METETCQLNNYLVIRASEKSRGLGIFHLNFMSYFENLITICKDLNQVHSLKSLTSNTAGAKFTQYEVSVN